MREITDKKELERLMGKSPKGKAVEPIKAIPAPGRRLMATTVETGIRGTPPPADLGDTPMMKAARKGISVGTIDPACLRGDECAGEPGDGFAIRDLPEGGVRLSDEDWNAALARVAPVVPPSGTWQLVPVNDLLPRADNPRRVNVSSEAFLALVASIRSAGIVTPLLGRPHPTEVGCVELLAGHRRRCAGREAGLTEFPVIVREMDDRTALEVLVFENLDRENLTPMEEARGVQLLLSSGHDAQEIADRMGKSRAWVARRANLLNLTGLWQKWAEEKGVSAAHLELIARWPKERQDQLYERLQECYEFDRLWMGPGSVKALAAEIADEMRELLRAPWSLDDVTLVPKAGACAVCPKRSGCQPDLFTEENEGGDRCLDPECWDEKMKGFKEVREAVLRKEYPGLVRVIGKHGSEYENGKRLTALAPWEYDKCTKKSTGAVPAIVVSGEGEGTLVWVAQKAGGKSPQKQLQSAAVKQAEASQDPKACEEILKEKREGLAKRRTAWVIQRLINLLMEADRPAAEFDNAEAYLAMVAGFGTEPVPYGNDADDDVPYVWETKAEGGMGARRAVWEMLKPKIRQEIGFHSSGNIAERHHDGCRWLANLLGANLDVLVEDSEKEIPEPRSWDGLQRLTEAPAKDPAKDKERPAKRPPLSKPGPGMFTRGVDPEAHEAPFDEGHAKAAYLGKVVTTNYGTGPYVVTDVSGPCQCSEKGEGKHTEWHVHLTCRDKEPQKGKGMLSFLAGYRLDGTSVWNSDRLLVMEDDAPAAAAPVAKKKSAKKKGQAA